MWCRKTAQKVLSFFRTRRETVRAQHRADEAVWCSLFSYGGRLLHRFVLRGIAMSDEEEEDEPTWRKNLPHTGDRNTQRRTRQLFFSTNEVADILGVSQSRVQKWIRKGKMKGHKLWGHRYRVHYMQIVGALGMDPETDAYEIDTITAVTKIDREKDKETLESLVRDYLEREAVSNRREREIDELKREGLKFVKTEVECTRCGGTGEQSDYTECFKCKGEGVIETQVTEEELNEIE